MAVPTFEKFLLPVLQLAADGAEHATGEAFEAVADAMDLTEVDRSELLSGGIQTRARNRFSWAIVYLSKAKLLEKPSRGRFRITQRGMDLLAENPPELSYRSLRRFDEFNQFWAPRMKPDAGGDDVGGLETVTPEERLEEAYGELRGSLAAELLERIGGCSPRFFEQLVVDLLVAMGYGGSRADAAQVVGKSGDGGIDGTIKEDKLGLDVIYVQAKRWEGTVGRKEVQSFAGSLEGERANKGVFITTSSFTSEAREYVRRIGKKVVLIDGKDLAQPMIDHGVGCTEVRRYVVSKPDSDYFEGDTLG